MELSVVETRHECDREAEDGTWEDVGAMTSGTATVTKNTVTRLDIPTGRTYDEFIAAFEAAVPPFDLPRMKDIAASGGTWDDIERAVAENAPNGFVIFGTIDGVRRARSASSHRSGARVGRKSGAPAASAGGRRARGTHGHAASPAFRVRRIAGYNAA